MRRSMAGAYLHLEIWKSTLGFTSGHQARTQKTERLTCQRKTGRRGVCLLGLVNHGTDGRKVHTIYVRKQAQVAAAL